MNINIQKVAAILKEKENQIKQNNNNIVLNTKALLKAKHELSKYGNRSYKKDSLKIIPENLYIRALSTGIIPNEIPNFNDITSELINESSEFIDYLIVSNPNISESIIKKLLTKNNITNAILIQLAKATRSTIILENLYNTDCFELQLAVLNNPNFARSEKCDLYYKHAFYNFDNYEFFSLKREVIPSDLLEAYEAAHYFRITKFDMQQHPEKKMRKTSSTANDEHYLSAYREEFAPIRLKYSMLVNNSKKMNENGL